MLPQIWPAILTLGWILAAIAAGETLMALFSLAADDGYADNFAISAALTLMVAVACVLTTKGRPFVLRFRDAALLTVVAWFIVPVFAALPFLAHPMNLPFIDAYFEMVSGLTTTGSSVLSGLDDMARTILLWRSTVQWIGGIGIIGLAIVILPFLKIGGMQLFRLESSDRSEKALPTVRGLAGTIGRIYLVLTVACFLTYWMLGMTPFDALNHALGTLPTSGFSTHDASFGYFDSRPIEWAGTFFMLSGALPFLAYVRFLRGGRLRDRMDPQVTAFVGFLFVTTAIFSTWLIFAKGVHPATAITLSAFNITSVVTTTGYASSDYLLWGPFAAGWFFILTFMGGCTGSTAGGLKMFRFQVMHGVIRQHVHRAVFPHVVAPVRFGTQVVSDEQIASVGGFVFLYLAAFAIVACVLAAIGLDTETAISASATAIGNVGPGIGPVIGPVGNFSSLPDVAKAVLCFAMIMGRIEILGVLIVLLPSFYR